MFSVAKFFSGSTPLIGILLLSLGHSTVCVAQQLTFVTVETSEDTAVSETVLREAYGRLNINLVIKKYPAERAIRLANRGLVDGEIQRVDAIKHNYVNLIQVQPAINVLEAVAFTRSIRFQPQGWDSLRPYRIGLIRGIKFAENNTVGMNRDLVSRYQSLFKMLDGGRIDVAVAPKINGLISIRKHNHSAINVMEPALMHFKLFHYLHRKNLDWVPKIEAVLHNMHQSGELQKIRQRIHLTLLETPTPKIQRCEQIADCERLSEEPSVWKNKNTAMPDEI